MQHGDRTSVCVYRGRGLFLDDPGEVRKHQARNVSTEDKMHFSLIHILDVLGVMLGQIGGSTY